MGYNIAVVGASGVVGRKILEMLEELKIDVSKLYLYTSARSAGQLTSFKGNEYEYLELCEENIVNKDIDYVLFSAGGSTSKAFVPIFAKNSVVIDNSSAFRMDARVPLVVPEVNSHELNAHNNIIANPNCSTIQSVVALKPLHDKYKIKRIVFCTYQAVSGAGKNGIDDLERGIRGEKCEFFPHPIFNNVLPHIDVFLPDGYTKEEYKMIDETRKILGDQSISITATTVRVPVFHGHSVCANVELYGAVGSLDEIKQTLANFPGLIVLDDVDNKVYPMPIDVAGKNEVYVGRIRLDQSLENGVNLWIVADNIRKGAATNAVQILQNLIYRREHGNI